MRSRIRRAAIAIAVVAVAFLGCGAAAAADPPAPVPGATAPGTTVTWGTEPADNQVGTGRPNFSYDAQPGGTLRDGIEIINRSDRALDLRVYASDAFTTASGGLDLLAADQKSNDVGTWITMASPSVTVPAGQSVTVPFTLTVPANATPGDHTGGIVTSLVTSSGGGPVAVDRRIGSRVYIRVAGQLQPALSVTDVQTSYDGTLNPAAGGTVAVTYTATNTGNVRLEARQRITSAGPFGLAAATVSPADLPELLPGASLTRTEYVPGSWPTVRITTEVVLEPYSSAGTLAVPVAEAVGSSGLWAFPFGQLLVLLGVIAVIAAYLTARRRRATRVEQAIAGAVAAALQDNAAADTAGTDRPNAVQPNVVQPNAVQPNAVQLNAVQPTAAQPGAVQPGPAEPQDIRPIRSAGRHRR